MEFVSPMKSILQQYQNLNTALQQGLLVIIYRSLPRCTQQNILVKLFKLELEHLEDGLSGFMDPSFILKVVEASQELRSSGKENVLNQLTDHVLDNQAVQNERLQARYKSMMSTIELYTSEKSGKRLNAQDQTLKLSKQGLVMSSFPKVRVIEKNSSQNVVTEMYSEVEMQDFDNCVEYHGQDNAQESKMNVKARAEVGKNKIIITPANYQKPDSARRVEPKGTLCEICNYVFASRFALRRHMAKHAENGGVYCNYCKRNNRFNTYEIMMRHRETYHPNICQCRMCSQTFLSQSARDKHEALHYKPTKRLKCKFCGQLFSQLCNIKYHIRKHHTGEKPYVCGVCQENFFDLASLQRHCKKYHGQKKPYMCEICHKRFMSQTECGTHISTAHSGEKAVVRIVVEEPVGKEGEEMEEQQKGGGEMEGHQGGDEVEEQHARGGEMEEQHEREGEMEELQGGGEMEELPEGGEMEEQQGERGEMEEQQGEGDEKDEQQRDGDVMEGHHVRGCGIEQQTRGSELEQPEEQRGDEMKLPVKEQTFVEEFSEEAAFEKEHTGEVVLEYQEM